MSGEGRLQLPGVVNPVSENLWQLPSKALFAALAPTKTFYILSKWSHIHLIWKMSTCEQGIINPEVRRWVKLRIAAPLTFNELVLHFQDNAVLKLPLPGDQFPCAMMSLSTRILSDTASVIELNYFLMQY